MAYINDDDGFAKHVDLIEVIQSEMFGSHDHSDLAMCLMLCSQAVNMITMGHIASDTDNHNGSCYHNEASKLFEKARNALRGRK